METMSFLPTPNRRFLRASVQEPTRFLAGETISTSLLLNSPITSAKHHQKDDVAVHLML